MRLSILSCLMSKTPKETELDDIVKIMRTSEKLCVLCREYQQLNDEGDKSRKDRIKKRMIPAFVPSALLFEGKAQRNIIGLTNLCYMDIDHIEEDQINEAINLLRLDEHVVFVARSMSRKGLHILAKYRFKDRKQPQITTMSYKRMAITYTSIFMTISTYYKKKLNLPIDDSGKNAVQPCNISYDEELYYNPNAKPYTLIYEHQKVGKKRKHLQIII